MFQTTNQSLLAIFSYFYGISEDVDMYVRDCKSKLSKAQTRHLRLEQSNIFQSSLLITFLPRITIFPRKITISAPKIYHCSLWKSISAQKIYDCSHLKNDIFHLSCASVCSSRSTRSPEESLLMPILGPILPGKNHDLNGTWCWFMVI
jgi:hypothetical protein